MSLSKIEVITSMSKFYNLNTALSKAAIYGMTVSQVLGCGAQYGAREYDVEEKKEMTLIPKQQITMVVPTEEVDHIIELLKQELYTGHIGDGKIFVSSMDNAIRVRTGEEGIEALKVKKS